MMAEEKAPGGGSKTRNPRRRPGNKQSTLKNEDAAQRKAALEAAIRKKIECERKALQVVECLLEDGITEDFLLDCGKLITPAHYKDVVEERSIIKLCGYPICQNRLQNVLKQRYQISTKTNKVYDITERKCFCSNFCYRASKYFENQISPSPVWLRDEERPPDIELLQQGARGHSGKEVKLVDEDIKPLDIENPVPEATLSDSGSDSESSSDAEQEFVSSVLQENLPKISPASCEKEDLDEDDLDGADLLKAAAFEEDSFNSFDPPSPFKGSSTAAKPLPSYEKLKEETSQMKLKVREFYQGKFTSAEEDLAAQSEKEQRHSSTEDDQQWIPVLPLVDSSAQQQIRTRIVLEKLQKVLPVVLGPLRIPLGDVYSEMKNLVKTFRLTNTNIIHKTPVWTLIAIVLLSVLSENIPMFASCQQNRGYTQFLATLLEELHFKHEDFESLTGIFKRDYLLY
nr:putative RNA polymerase II subunit B1 CTD phosphatase RPAP2 isoform X3 [Pogona vitticeps]